MRPAAPGSPGGVEAAGTATDGVLGLATLAAGPDELVATGNLTDHVPASLLLHPDRRGETGTAGGTPAVPGGSLLLHPERWGETSRGALEQLALALELDQAHALHLVSVSPFDRLQEAIDTCRLLLPSDLVVFDLHFEGPQLSPIHTLLEQAPPCCLAGYVAREELDPRRPVLFITGLDASLDAANPEQPSVLQHVNAMRDRLLDLRAPTVFWISEETFDTIVARLPDFASWVTVAARIREPIARSGPQFAPVSAEWAALANLSGPQKSDRIRALEGVREAWTSRQAAPGTGETLHRVRVLGELSFLCTWMGQDDAALRALHDGLALVDQVPQVTDPEVLATRAALYGLLAGLHQRNGAWSTAKRIHEDECIPLYEALGDRRGLSASLHALAGIEAAQGNPGEARRLLQRSQQKLEALGDARGLSASLHALAGIEAAQGNLGEARRLYARSIALFEGVSDMAGRAASLAMLARLEAAAGNREHALELAREAVRDLEARGYAQAEDARAILRTIQ